MAFDQERDATARGRRQTAYVFAENAAFAAPGTQISHQYVDGGGLACAVFAEEAENASLGHVKRQTIIYLPASVVSHRQILYMDHRLAGEPRNVVVHIKNNPAPAEWRATCAGGLRNAFAKVGILAQNRNTQI